MRSFPWCVSSLLVVAASVHAVEPDFQRDIRPILSNACFKCHGPDGDERKGGKKGSGGLRKVRWSRAGVGKSGGARVVTYHVSDEGRVWLLVAYAKAKFDTLPTDFLVELKKEIDHAQRR